MERKISPGRYVPRTQLPNLDDLDNEISDYYTDEILDSNGYSNLMKILGFWGGDDYILHLEGT